jgi:aspartate/methionine/tyrosine aminotransferase
MQIREFLIERYYARHEFTTPFQLSASDCEALSVEEVLELGGVAPEELLRLRLGYTETRGAPALRQAIARRYPGCSADDVLVFNAPQEAIFLAMHALLAPGERAVVMTPCYQSLKDVARSVGSEVVEWPLLESDSGWRLDLGRLEELLRPDTRLLVTNAPHNPTGLQPTADEWRRIHELARERGVRWFSDEMYRGLEPEPALALPPAASLAPDALSLWGTSKSFGLPGLRIGWLVSRDRALLARIEGLKDYTSICSNAPGELLARAALGAAEPILARNRERIAANVERMEAFARRHRERLVWLRPMAGSVSLVRLLSGSAREYAERVRTDAGVLLVPSELFDLGDRHVRVGLGREGFAEALERWEGAGV